MKRKINTQMMYVAVMAIFATVIALTAIFYNLLKEQVFDDLRSYALILEKTGTSQLPDKDRDSVLRITLVGNDGQVLFDSVADEKEMENHAARKEIRQAFSEGEGKAIRRSETLSRNTYYYAVLLSDGNVLRVAKESSSPFRIILRFLPVLALLVAVLLCICALFSRFLIKSIVRPIEEMASDIDHMDSVEGYPELEPFIRTINEQHKDIVKSADMRQEFTANVTHELKTPLTSISGYSELIENGMVGEEDAIRFAKEIHRNANRLLHLINDIIRLSELDSPAEPTPFEQVDLYDLAQNCVEMLQMNAENHHVKLALQGRKSVVYGSRQMLDEVLFNLCDNAIRYNVENGSVLVTVDEEDDNVFLSVKDTGIGIDREHQQRVFERFYRVDKSRSKQTGGTGLGLAIVKHIVALHRAELTLESQPGKGTEIKITFV